MANINFNRVGDEQYALNLPRDFDGNFQIWRYLSLTKFLKLLEDQHLYLCKISDFDDPFEGSLPRTHPDVVEEFRDRYNMPEGAVEGYDHFLRNTKDYAFINCWHISNYESAAMWSIYSKTKESIAVRSTYRRLYNEINGNAQVGSVEYIDYQNDYLQQGNMMYHCLCKRKSYSYENEFRVIVYDMANHINGQDTDDHKTVDVNLDNLVERIYVSPDAPGYFPDLIESILEKYDHEFDVVKSSINDDPFI